MNKLKENFQSRHEQNIISLVLMICFMLLSISFWSAFSVDMSLVKNTQSLDKVTINQ